jgi:hypothetical protein
MQNYGDIVYVEKKDDYLKQNWLSVINQLHEKHYELSKMETVFTYKVWNFTFYSYGESSKYKPLSSTNGNIRLCVTRTQHIIRDPYKIYTSKKKLYAVKF